MGGSHWGRSDRQQGRHPGRQTPARAAQRRRRRGENVRCRPPPPQPSPARGQQGGGPGDWHSQPPSRRQATSSTELRRTRPHQMLLRLEEEDAKRSIGNGSNDLEEDVSEEVLNGSPAGIDNDSLCNRRFGLVTNASANTCGREDQSFRIDTTFCRRLGNSRGNGNFKESCSGHD